MANMGNLFSFESHVNDPRRVWPIRYFHQITNEEDLSAARFDYWDPKMYAAKLAYPAKEPPKDF